MEEAKKPVVIRAKNLKKTYYIGETSVHALNGVDFSIYKGEFIAIVGTSCSGKSTLLNMLAGLEKPSSGEIIVAGQHIERMTETELVTFRREHVGFIFQSFNLMPTMNSIENVALPLTFRGMKKDKREKLARAALKLVGLTKTMKHRPTQMSGGQQQRVGIARAFVTRPEVVFADEPTGNLDSHTTKEVMHMIRSFAKKYHQTIILVSHDKEMTEYADRIVTLIDGEIVSNVKNIVSKEIDEN